MIRLVICAVVIGLCALIGEGFAYELRLRSRLMKQISSALASFEVMIRYQKSTVAELLRMLEESGEHDLLLDQLRKSEHSAPPLLRSGERQSLDTLLSSLGTTDEEGQLALLGRTREEFKYYEARAREDEEKKSRLYRALGLLGGIFIAALTF